MKRVLLVSIALFAALASSADAANRYVATTGSDANACTSASPCATFDRANAVASGGDQVLVAAGTYGAQTIASRLNASVVSFHPYNGYVTVAGVAVVNSRNVELRGITSTAPLDVESSQHVTLSFVTVKNIVATNPGIYFAGVDDLKILDSEVKDLDSVDGIRGGTTQPSPNTDILIQRTFVHDLSRVTNPGEHVDCVQIEDGQNVKILQSRFNRCSTQGLFFSPNNGRSISDILVENSWLGEAQDGVYMLNIGDASHFTFRNNSVAGNSINIDLHGTVSDVHIVANLLREWISNSCDNLTALSVEFKYNITDVACTYADATNLQDSSLLANWVQPSTTSSAAFDLHLQYGAFAVDKGSTLFSAPLDIDDVSRSGLGSAPDPGADELVPGPDTGGDARP